MNYGLEVVVIPVSDVDKAKDFYQWAAATPAPGATSSLISRSWS